MKNMKKTAVVDGVALIVLVSAALLRSGGQAAATEL